MSVIWHNSFRDQRLMASAIIDRTLKVKCMFQYSPSAIDRQGEMSIRPNDVRLKLIRKARSRALWYAAGTVAIFMIVLQQMTDWGVFYDAYVAHVEWAGICVLGLTISIIVSAVLFWYCCVQAFEGWHDWRRWKVQPSVKVWNRY